MRTVTITFRIEEGGSIASNASDELVMEVNGERWTPMDVCELLCRAKDEVFIEITDEVAAKFTIAPHPSKHHN